MPIHLDFFHPNRLAIVVAREAITADEIRDALKTVLETGALHYRKILDISATTNPMDDEGIEAIAALVRSQPNAAARGPLAFVVSPGRAAENAEKFAQLTAGERPVKVFHSLHAARKWLDENSSLSL